MTKRATKVTVESEVDRLNKLFESLPENKKNLVEGLILQAARLRVRLSDLWKDIQDNGDFEMFSQSDKTEPYQRERPSSRLFLQADKNYQNIISKLLELLPEQQRQNKLNELIHR